jgi:hypothetical protein
MDNIYMTDDEIQNLTADDFRELTAEETTADNFRRMFQMMNIIYRKQSFNISLYLLNQHSPDSQSTSQ